MVDWLFYLGAPRPVVGAREVLKEVKTSLGSLWNCNGMKQRQLVVRLG